MRATGKDAPYSCHCKESQPYRYPKKNSLLSEVTQKLLKEPLESPEGAQVFYGVEKGYSYICVTGKSPTLTDTKKGTTRWPVLKECQQPFGGTLAFLGILVEKGQSYVCCN